MSVTETKNSGPILSRLICKGVHMPLGISYWFVYVYVGMTKNTRGLAFVHFQDLYICECDVNFLPTMKMKNFDHMYEWRHSRSSGPLKTNDVYTENDQICEKNRRNY